MAYIISNMFSTFLKYGSFAAIIASFLCDFSKKGKKTFFVWTFFCVLYVSAVRVALEEIFDVYENTYSSAITLISLANCLICAIVAIKFLVKIPAGHIVYAFSITLEFACYITGNGLWNIYLLIDSSHTMWIFLIIIVVFSAVTCFIIRKFIIPLYVKEKSGKTWLLLSISPLLGSIGYYVIMNVYSGNYFYQLQITTGIGISILFFALMAANAICAVSVYHSAKMAEYHEKLNAANQLLSLQKEQYVEKITFEQRTDELRHDFRHQVATISELLQKGEIDHLKEYLSKYSENIPATVVSTGNTTADVIFGHYLSIAKKNDIEVSYQISLPVNCRISDLDITVIIGNCMENAIEASLRLPKDQRLIKVRSRLSNDFLMFVFENNFDGKVINKRGKIYSMKRNGDEEGIGLVTVRRAVEQYGGEMFVENTDKTFIVKLSLNISSLNDEDKISG